MTTYELRRDPASNLWTLRKDGKRIATAKGYTIYRGIPAAIYGKMNDGAYRAAANGETAETLHEAEDGTIVRRTITPEQAREHFEAIRKICRRAVPQRQYEV